MPRVPHVLRGIACERVPSTTCRRGPSDEILISGLFQNAAIGIPSAPAENNPVPLLNSGQKGIFRRRGNLIVIVFIRVQVTTPIMPLLPGFRERANPRPGRVRLPRLALNSAAHNSPAAHTVRAVKLMRSGFHPAVVQIHQNGA